VAKFDKVIPPGQEGKVNLVIDGKKVTGSFSKSATIRSNDPETPVVSVSMVGQEIPYVQVEPNRVYLQGRYGEKIERAINISSNEEDLDFEVTGVTSNIDDKITYKAEKLDDGTYNVKLWKNPKLPTLNTYGTLFVHTNSEHSPESVVQVQVVTKGSITVQPSTINFGGVQFSSGEEDARPVKKQVTLIRSDGEFKIQDIQFSSDNYEAKYSEVVPGKRYSVAVTFHPPVKTQARQREVGEMIIHTNDPTEPTLTVKLVARAM
jgi:hypothetical protein